MAGYRRTHTYLAQSEMSRSRVDRIHVCTVIAICACDHQLLFVALICGHGSFYDLVSGTRPCYRQKRPLSKRNIMRVQ